MKKIPFLKSVTLGAAAALAFSTLPGVAQAQVPDTFTECEAHNSIQDICYVYEYDPLLGQYLLIQVYFVPRGGETPPPDTID
ncbi:hypothetical protein [Maricaulis sp.]|uniref:hypothetical protein n=1 Tax=Maricaulis sp. TaxID=1486257 RepID=UPI003299E78D